jgi:hypothetical protein
LTNVSNKNRRKNQNIDIVLNNILSKNRTAYDIMWNIWYSQTEHRWHYNKMHAHCMLDNYGYKHTRRICNIYCFSTAVTVTRTCLDVTLHVHCLPR